MNEQEQAQLQGLDYKSLALLVLRLRDAHCEHLDRILALEAKVKALETEVRVLKATDPRRFDGCANYDDDAIGED